MNGFNNGPQAELFDLCGIARDGELSAEQFDRLQEILERHPEARPIYVQFFQLHSWLARHVSSNGAFDGAKQHNGSRNQLENGVFNRLTALGFSSNLLIFPPIDPLAEGSSALNAADGAPPIATGLWQSTLRGSVSWLIVLLVAVVITSVATYRIARTTDEQLTPILVQSPGGVGEKTQRYAATLINVTNCRWDSARTTANGIGRRLEPGQSLNLLEGVAEINTVLPDGSAGRFQLEGPLGMMLNSRGMPSLQYGKLTAQIDSDFETFTLDTTLGRVVMRGESSVGVIGAASDVELHVFGGMATFEPWSTGFETSEPLMVTAGKSLRVRVADENISIERAIAHETWFVTSASMESSRLNISDEYVHTIRQAKPIAYFRFEEPGTDVVRNEMDDRFHVHVEGEPIRWRQYRGNHYVEFGSTPQGGRLMTNETFDEVLDEFYSVEAWIKPSHFHHGTIFSLWQYSPEVPAQMSEHSMVVELCGVVAAPRGSMQSWTRHPGRIRFVHRNPPRAVGGASCFSGSSYALRKWQHVVCTKDRSTIRLYLDGILVGEAPETTTLARGVRLLIGQLRPLDVSRTVPVRPFAGEMDELAIYDRTLDRAEIIQHFELVQSGRR